MHVTNLINPILEGGASDAPPEEKQLLCFSWQLFQLKGGETQNSLYYKTTMGK